MTNKPFQNIEKLDYEVFGGFIVVNLNINHLSSNKFPFLWHLIKYLKLFRNYLLISHIYPTSKLSEFDDIHTGYLIDKVNGEEVKTINEYRQALKNPHINENNKKKYIVITGLFQSNKIILDFDETIKQEKSLIKNYRYPPSDTYIYFKNKK